MKQFAEHRRDVAGIFKTIEPLTSIGATALWGLERAPRGVGFTLAVLAVVLIGGTIVFPAYHLAKIILSLGMMVVRIAALFDAAAGKRWAAPCV